MFCKKVILIFLFLLIFSIGISGCGIVRKKGEEGSPKDDEHDPNDDIEDDTNTRETVLFYQDDFGYLIPVMRKIQWEEGIAKATLSKLVDAPEQQQVMLDMGLKPLLPANTQIKGISIKEGVAKVDFNDIAMDYSNAIAENNMVQGVVMTLVEFPAIEKVQFMFEGKIVDNLKHGTKVGSPIGAEDLNLELSSETSGGGTDVMVFFHNTSPSRYDYLVPITRVISSASATIETAIGELLKGPKTGANLHLDIPEDTRLLGAQMDDGITYINLSKEFGDLKDYGNETMVLKAITMTAKQFPEVSKVKILVDGVEYDGEYSLSTPTFANEY